MQKSKMYTLFYIVRKLFILNGAGWLLPWRDVRITKLVRTEWNLNLISFISLKWEQMLYCVCACVCVRTRKPENSYYWSYLMFNSSCIVQLACCERYNSEVEVQIFSRCHQWTVWSSLTELSIFWVSRHSCYGWALWRAGLGMCLCWLEEGWSLLTYRGPKNSAGDPPNP